MSAESDDAKHHNATKEGYESIFEITTKDTTSNQKDCRGQDQPWLKQIHLNLKEKM